MKPQVQVYNTQYDSTRSVTLRTLSITGDNPVTEALHKAVMRLSQLYTS